MDGSRAGKSSDGLDFFVLAFFFEAKTDGSTADALVFLFLLASVGSLISPWSKLEDLGAW